ncbi:hypothetical protein VTO73DRAFT_3812 [Trametes versicolor]
MAGFASEGGAGRDINPPAEGGGSPVRTTAVVQLPHAAHILNTSVHPPPNTSPSRCSLASLSPLSSPSHSLRPPRAATPAPSSAATALRSLTLLRAPLSSPSSGSSSATSPGASVSAARRSPSSASARAPAPPAPSAARTTTSYVFCLAFAVCSSVDLLCLGWPDLHWLPSHRALSSSRRTRRSLIRGMVSVILG